MKVRDLLTDETKWTKGAFARDKEGKVIGSGSPLACCWCLSGAAFHCVGDDSDESAYAILARIRERVGHASVAAWNDDPKRTFAEVRALVEELDI